MGHGFVDRIRAFWHSDIMARTVIDQSVFSFLQNEYLIKQNFNWDDFEPYKYYKKVHEYLNIEKLLNNEISRVGGKMDGGYLMAQPLSSTKVAYSFGIGQDVSWDVAMAKRGYNIFMYDHTVNKLPEHNASFIWEKTGIGKQDSGKLKTLKTLMSENGHMSVEGMILKMDVEGAEWDALQSCDLNDLSRFDQIVIELHRLYDVEKWDQILEVLEKLHKRFGCIHLHGCNGSKMFYCKDLATPGVIEATYVNRNKYELVNGNDVLLPNKHDRPDYKDIQDMWLGRWNV